MYLYGSKDTVGSPSSNSPSASRSRSDATRAQKQNIKVMTTIYKRGVATAAAPPPKDGSTQSASSSGPQATSYSSSAALNCNPSLVINNLTAGNTRNGGGLLATASRNKVRFFNTELGKPFDGPSTQANISALEYLQLLNGQSVLCVVCSKGGGAQFFTEDGLQMLHFFNPNVNAASGAMQVTVDPATGVASMPSVHGRRCEYFGRNHLHVCFKAVRRAGREPTHCFRRLERCFERGGVFAGIAHWLPVRHNSSKTGCGAGGERGTWRRL